MGNRPRRLPNEALRPPKAAREASRAARGPLRALRGGFCVVSRLPRGRKKEGPEKWRSISLSLGLLFAPFRAFSMKKSSRERKRRKSVNHRFTYGKHRFLRGRGLQNESRTLKKAPKTAENERPEKRREKRSLRELQDGILDVFGSSWRLCWDYFGSIFAAKTRSALLIISTLSVILSLLFC